jgi:predicted ribosome quality control (RQC) complex YloA/Tae2 family protein
LNREYYKFKYLPLEGALPGLYFQQQTEDAINDIGNVAYATEQVADEALKIGDLLCANAHLVVPHQKSVKLEDFEGKETVIELPDFRSQSRLLPTPRRRA